MIRFILFFIIVPFNTILFAQAPEIQWTKTFGNRGNFFDTGYSVQQTHDEGYVVLGPGTKLLKTDINGDTLWTKTLEGTGHVINLDDTIICIKIKHQYIKIYQLGKGRLYSLLIESKDFSKHYPQHFLRDVGDFFTKCSSFLQI